MTYFFISHARSTEVQAHQIAGAPRASGHDVWRDKTRATRPAHTDVLKAELKSVDRGARRWPRGSGATCGTPSGSLGA